MTAAQISDPWPGSCWEAKYGKGKKKKSCSYSSPLEQLDLPTLLPSHDYFSLITATEEGVLMRDKSRNSRMLHNCFYWGVKIYRKEHGKCLKTESSDSGFITEVAMWPKKNHIISLASLFFRVSKMDFCTVGWQWESREEIHIEAFPKKPDCSGHRRNHCVNIEFPVYEDPKNREPCGYHHCLVVTPIFSLFSQPLCRGGPQEIQK